ncbi:GAF domain-containing protein [Ornithinimicrobium sp. LYQ92]|uniref:GAF domain-containing protein n=1 Tax=Serinicoccus sp. LYQ92 TaxID=3378798 RepID=UPI0038545421
MDGSSSRRGRHRASFRIRPLGVLFGLLVLACILSLAAQDYWPGRLRGEDGLTRWGLWALIVLSAAAWFLPRLDGWLREREQESERRGALAKADELYKVLSTNFPLITAKIQTYTTIPRNQRADRESIVGGVSSEVLDAALRVAEGEGGRSTLFWWQPERGAFVPAESKGRSPMATTVLKPDADSPESPFMQMLLKGVPQVEVRANRSKPYRCYVSAAIRSLDGRVFGILTLDHVEEDGLDDQDGDVLFVLADLLAIAIVGKKEAPAWTAPA